jgi:hypothetical protein
MLVRLPKPASNAVACVHKIIDLPNGVDEARYGTGFFYRSDDGAIWLVTNWHVLTGRRPDEPGVLLGNAPQSPSAISFGARLKGSAVHKVCEFPLYTNGEPLWRQHPRGPYYDIAALPITLSDDFEVTTIQDAATGLMGAIEPGFDLIVVGFPFAAGRDVPYPLWKRAMLASEPSVPMFGNSQMLIDTAGTPGMSGSPVFMSHMGYIDTPETVAARARVDAGETSWTDEPDWFGVSRETQTVGLEWVGIYAGATENKALDRLQLGRMYAASAAMK